MIYGITGIATVYLKKDGSQIMMQRRGGSDFYENELPVKATQMEQNMILGELKHNDPLIVDITLVASLKLPI